MQTQATAKITQLFTFLRELNQIKNPLVRRVDDQPWLLYLDDLPRHESVHLVLPDPRDESAGEDFSAGTSESYLLRVGRAVRTDAPPLPKVLEGWVRDGFESVEKSPERIASRVFPSPIPEDSPVTEPFEERDERSRAWQNWLARWNDWAERERPARAALALFQRLYDLYGQIEREGERFDLVLGDGLLHYQGIRHPVVLERLSLSFDADAPAFYLRETDNAVEFYAALFQELPDVNADGLRMCREELERLALMPLDTDIFDGFLRRVAVTLSSAGEFVGNARTVRAASPDVPRLSRAPVVFLRKRSGGFSTALDSILENVGSREISPALLAIVGIEPPPPPIEETSLVNDGASVRVVGDARVLLSLPANPEQVQIARRLDENGAVIVQGPPGTGKTHTIANLLGHLLAQGKSVLVTSHTTKALRVLREKVALPLQSLCVSVLDSDRESSQQLESAVGGIVERLQSESAENLAARAKLLAGQRAQLLKKHEEIWQRLLAARNDEYRAIVIGGADYSPIIAAQQTAENAHENGWIPAPVAPGALPPLSPGELVELYRTNDTLTPDEEHALERTVPDPAALPTPAQFAALSAHLRDLVSRDKIVRSDLFPNPALVQEPGDLENLAERLRSVLMFLDNRENWELTVIDAGISRLGETRMVRRQIWVELIAEVERVYALAGESESLLLRHSPTLAPTTSEEQSTLLDAIIQHLEKGELLNWFALLRHGDWKKLIAESRVNDHEPKTIDEFRALSAAASLARQRAGLNRRWQQQMGSLGAVLPAETGQPEQLYRRYLPPMNTALKWHNDQLKPLITEIEAAGFRWEILLAEMPPRLDAHGELWQMRDALYDGLLPALLRRADALRFRAAQEEKAALEATLERSDATAPPVAALLSAAQNLDDANYRSAYDALLYLTTKRDDLLLRRNLLTRLEAVAPAWAAAVQDRSGIHGQRTPPGDAQNAWIWRQLRDELERRSQTSLEVLQKQLDTTRADLQTLTGELVDSLAWGAQLRRTSLRQRQSLIGWLQTIKRIGKGTGKRAPMLRNEARKQMEASRDAVPVWIMPLSRVVESFDPRNSSFDVVIIDEASQSDAMALIAVYMGKQVVVVGDNEQVSPDAVGTDLTRVDNLIAQYLSGIPNAKLYDGQQSVYDIALRSFGGAITLREHYRCVPEIIGFSNRLSYNGKIKPLRDSVSARVFPPLVAYHVESFASADKTNTREAERLVALLVAATEQPEYANLTLGVIALVGDDQSGIIENLLRAHLAPAEYERRRILCGSPPQFQGDERDVMFLSVVDTPRDGGGVLSLRADDRFKKRFNVAASRARDQMWVVHSLDTAIDVKPGDLRRELITYARNSATATEAENLKQTESPFERQVMQELLAEGYRVTPQWQVGYYRIDLVVEGEKRRLAVECDGEQSHPPDKLEEDMERQAILERLGWQFLRIRGSVFFRDTIRAMRPLYERLSELGIEPTRAGSPALTDPAQPEYGTDLQNRVIRRADALLLEWGGKTATVESEIPATAAYRSDKSTYGTTEEAG